MASVMPPMQQSNNSTWKSVPIVTVTWRYFIALRSITYRRCLFAFRQISFQPAAHPACSCFSGEGLTCFKQWIAATFFRLPHVPVTAWATLFVSGQIRDTTAIQSQFLGETLCIELLAYFVLPALRYLENCVVRSMLSMATTRSRPSSALLT
jgi:hypothetical protein